MGLDISVYVDVRKVADYVEGAWLDDLVLIHPSYEKTFPGRAAPLEVGYYSGERAGGFVAGGYSAYSRWRDWLAKAAGYPGAENVWLEKPEGPFVELIDFYDNEGVLGTEVCRKLFCDFSDPQVLVRAENLIATDAWPGTKRAGDWFKAMYNDFKNAFEVAGERNGVVVFH